MDAKLLSKLEPIIKELESINTQEEWDRWREDNPENANVVAKMMVYWLQDFIQECFMGESVIVAKEKQQ